MRPSRPLFATLVGAQLLYPRVPPRGHVAATHAIVGLLAATTAADAVEEGGVRKALATVGSAGAIGYAVELAGVATDKPFGHLPTRGPPESCAAAHVASQLRPQWWAAYGASSPTFCVPSHSLG